MPSALESSPGAAPPSSSPSPPPPSPPLDAERGARWLGLLLTPHLGARGIHRLLREIGGPEAIADASLTTLEACGIQAAAAQFLRGGRSWDAGYREWEKVRAQGVQLVTLHDPEYPLRLRETYDPPPLLYVRGAVAALDRFAVAVVGTRHPTPYGRLMAERLGRGLREWGLVVVSGLARGVDGLAQRACVECGGVSVAVLGTGVDVIYPKENEKLAAQLLAAGGAIVSEFPLGSYPATQNFPIRNRVISGLSLGVVVVEGGEYSGSRITARLALEQSREVYGVPGLATNRQAWVPNTLIKQGAKLVTEAADVIEELPFEVRQRLQAPVPPVPPGESAAAEGASKGGPNVRDQSSHDQSGDFAVSAPVQAAVLSRLRVGETSQLEELADQLEARFSVPLILAALLELELAGKIQQLPGKNYTRTDLG